MKKGDDQKKLAYALFDAMNKRQFTALEPSLSDDLVFDFPGAGQIEGRRRVLLFLNALLRKYPRLEFTVTDVFYEADRMCAVWSNKGVSSSGQPYSNQGVTLFLLSGDKVQFISDYFKDTSFINQD